MQDYNLAAVRELLLAAFTPNTLWRFCQDRPTFSKICLEFSPDQGLAERVDRVITYCDKQGLFSDLLDAIKQEIPNQYTRFEPQLPAPTADRPTPGAPTAEPLPADADRAHEAAFQTYLDRSSEMLRDGLCESAPGDVSRRIARWRTLTVLDGLDGGRRGQVVRFLFESGLITGEPVIDLRGANLRGALLNGPSQGWGGHQTGLGVNLAGANLTGVDLYNAEMVQINLAGASLVSANLGEASLEFANLSGADLRGASMYRACLLHADLISAKLSPAPLAPNTPCNLRNANLEGARLNGVDLTYTILTGANLANADLTQAKIAPGLLAEVASLKGATMPDGTGYD